MTRGAREGVYPALALLVFAGAAGVALRYEGWRSSLIRWVVLLGLASAFTWLTREEGLWIVPMIAVTLVLGVFTCSQRRQVWMAWVGAAALWAGVLGLVVWKNWRHYGMAVLFGQTGGAVTDAYCAMTRVRPADLGRSLPLPPGGCP